MPTITLQDLIKARLTRDAQAFRVTDAGTINAGKVEYVPVPHSFQTAPTATPTAAQAIPERADLDADLDAIFARVDALSARCDALIKRNGVWTRYITEGE